MLYHYAQGDVKYGGTGFLKYTYLFILLTHIVLSVAVVPLALFSVYRGLSNSIEKHRKIVRFAWPIWLYVSVTGVIVYLFAHVFNSGINVNAMKMYLWMTLLALGLFAAPQ